METKERVAPQKLNDAQLLDAFPEAKQIVPDLIAELIGERQGLVAAIGDALALINAQSDDEAFIYFWTLWLMLNEGQELQAVDTKLSQLYRLRNVIEGKPAPKGKLSENDIEAARAVPIADIIGEPVRRSGKDYLCLCPMHDDHSPSLHVYTEQNRAWCYSCNDGGDSIKFYMLINGCDFKTAVMELAGGMR
jgi:hypothetical protein